MSTVPEDRAASGTEEAAEMATGEREPERDDDDDDAMSGKHSLVSSTPSLAVFNIGSCAAAAVRSMQGIANIGRREHWLISRRDLQLLDIKTLGKGGQGFVICGLLHGAPVAVKITRSLPDLPHLGGICNELRVLRQVRHPNIATLYGACLSVQPADIGIVTELVDGDTLDALITKGMPRSLVATLPSTSERVALVQQVGCAIMYLHSLFPVCVHGDVKLANVMVERSRSGLRAKLIDFGLARLMTLHSRPLGGSLRWTAPEVLLGYSKPHPAADVFSYGRLVYFVATARRPFADADAEQIFESMKSLSRFPELEWPAECELMTYKEVVSACCQWEASERLAMADVYASTLRPGERRARDLAQRGGEDDWHQPLREARGRLNPQREDCESSGHSSG
jgi:serine/threonine protein kinase